MLGDGITAGVANSVSDSEGGRSASSRLAGALSGVVRKGESDDAPKEGFVRGVAVVDGTF